MCVHACVYAFSHPFQIWKPHSKPTFLCFHRRSDCVCAREQVRLQGGDDHGVDPGVRLLLPVHVLHGRERAHPHVRRARRFVQSKVNMHSINHLCDVNPTGKRAPAGADSCSPMNENRSFLLELTKLLFLTGVQLRTCHKNCR